MLTRSIEIQAIARYVGSIVLVLEAAGSSRFAPLLAALLAKFGPDMESFHMVRNLVDCLVLGMAAPGTTLNGTVGMNAHGPAIQPIQISLRTLSENPSQFVCTKRLCGANQDTGGVLAE